ncbi:cobalt-precorrin-6A reductase [Actinoplanes derwentensis]|uniref:Precorrin-6A/cobalt-precorrin-6A reductase n=1 Tax=Actinoplanes derwentensis TaxID=113562 RepID=A0A1H2D6E9_9ACTN|nr:cobalt-precorrin-6A reductase [Actinoplanes derwentensis]GID85564.1 precorrin-6A reductase [Actinoplanes derwentensis]SDT78338.1 precorrin-6A/cobalt-precorrin-6A reductase [Actinoplanes derwentensis]
MKVLVLGGTTEARRLAGLIHGEFAVVSSLAGRTSAPLLPAGEVRIGGFGGATGLAGYLRDTGVGAVVDATHPFAATMSGNVFEACAGTGVPLMILRRPAWSAGPGDDWHRVASLPAAAAGLPHLGRRVFLTTGRQGLPVFAGLDECWFLSRSVEAPTGDVPRNLEVLLDRGPFTVAGELAILTRHHIDVLVTKDSGGSPAKLAAAHELGIPVLMVNRPATPPAPVVATPDEAAAWLRTLRR